MGRERGGERKGAQRGLVGERQTLKEREGGRERIREGGREVEEEEEEEIGRALPF